MILDHIFGEPKHSIKVCNDNPLLIKKLETKKKLKGRPSRTLSGCTPAQVTSCRLQATDDGDARKCYPHDTPHMEMASKMILALS